MPSWYTRISLDRSIWSYSRVQRLVGAVIRNRKYQFLLAHDRYEYVNIGCGPFLLEGFYNIDWGWRPNVYCFDITKGIPIPDASVRGIFSEHCLEYLKPPRLLEVLKDFHRMLRPGGIARIVLPDGGLYCRLYVQAMRGEPVTWPYPEPGKTPIYYVNRIMTDYGHYIGFIYDFETLRQMMLAAGFREVNRETYKRGRDPKLLADQEHRAIESFYAEGIR
jgi:predicted SAM-dependent methyltransferase